MDKGPLFGAFVFYVTAKLGGAWLTHVDPVNVDSVDYGADA